MSNGEKSTNIGMNQITLDKTLHGEMVAEGGARTAYHFAKNTPYRRVRKLERKTAKLKIKAEYNKVLHENPGLQKNPIARMVQKRRIKQQYTQAVRDVQHAGEKAVVVAKKATAAAKVGAKVKAVLAAPKVLIIGGLLLLVISLLFGLISSCSNMATGIGTFITATTYLAEDAADIDAAELYYTELETDLALRINNTESEWQGYDEYRYQIGDISHNPFELMAYLTAVHHDFTFADILPVLDELFSEQYTLTFTPTVEIRYYYTENGPVPYNWYVLTVRLTSRPFYNVVSLRMNTSQSEHYGLLMRSKGNRQYSYSPFGFNWLPFVSSHYGYRVHPISGTKDYHLGVDIAVPVGTDILAGHNGTVTFAGYSGGYGYVVVIEGGEGLVTKYAHCGSLLVSVGQTVELGDIVAKSGNSGDSTGPHLHFEVIRNGRYLNPLFFAITNDDGDPPVYGYAGSPMGDGSFAALLAEAERYIGYPYVFGGSHPPLRLTVPAISTGYTTRAGRLVSAGPRRRGYSICVTLSP